MYIIYCTYLHLMNGRLPVYLRIRNTRYKAVELLIICTVPADKYNNATAETVSRI